MNRTFAAVVVIASLAVSGCATGRLSDEGAASPSLAAPSLTVAAAPSVSPTRDDEPAQRGRQLGSGLDPRWPPTCRHVSDAAVGHGLQRAPARL